MAVSHIDPARLQGDALKRWYLRSPADLEKEREEKTARAYGDYFASNLSDTVVGNHIPVSSSCQCSSCRKSGDGRPAVGSGSDHKGSFFEGYKTAASASQRGAWDYWGPRGCQSCHGYTPETLPPIGGRMPYPQGYSPRSGYGNGEGGAQPGPRDKKECEQQFNSDNKICARLTIPSDIAICRSTASQRYGNCLKPNGPLGFPPLETRGGRRA